MTTRVFVHPISDSDEIEYVNDEWRLFAEENGAKGLGCQDLVERVRTRQDPVRLSFRCDSPTSRSTVNPKVSN